MNNFFRATVVTVLFLFVTLPVQAKSRHEMCEVAKMAIETISQRLGDSIEITAQKTSAVHNQCFTAPLSEITETYQYLIDNWESVFKDY